MAEENRNTSTQVHHLQSILSSTDRNFLIRNNGRQVPITELEGKTVGLYFSLFTFPSCKNFDLKLRQAYDKLKEKVENFEIVLLPLFDDNNKIEDSVELNNFPWLSVPIGDDISKKLGIYFELCTLPTLVIIGPDGKTLRSNAAEAIEDHGILAYPFTHDKFAELQEIQKSQTLESILVFGHNDFVVGKDGLQVPVSDLVGKHILLYFSAQWCSPCRAFLPKLVEAYHKIKAKDDSFEVIFISSDKDEDSFTEFFSEMPWLAIPFGDTRKVSLGRVFKVEGIPMLVVIGPTGKTVTTEARSLLLNHGAEAYPFTEERMKEIEEQYNEMAKGWPEKINHALHEDHELVLTRRQAYTCNACNDEGQAWSFFCEECDFYLHPKFSLEEKQEDAEKDTNAESADGKTERWICEGDVCRKA